MTTEPRYPSTVDLASRWGVSVSTARNLTRQEDFPDGYAFSPRKYRWNAVDIDTRDDLCRRPVRRVMTGLPQDHVPAGKVYLRRSQAAA